MYDRCRGSKRRPPKDEGWEESSGGFQGRQGGAIINREIWDVSGLHVFAKQRRCIRFFELKYEGYIQASAEQLVGLSGGKDHS